ncbi:MAG: hypothetical protein V3U65_07235 [Granulosicoccaceae bacterium]
MSFNLKFTVVALVLAILLWFAFYAFLSSTSLSLFGLKTSKSTAGGGTFNAQSHTAAGFVAFEELKALEDAEEKAKEKRSKELKGREKDAPAIENMVTNSNTQQSSNNVSAQQATGQPEQQTINGSKPNPVFTNIRAIDAILSVKNSINCQDNYVAGVFFRKNSTAMRGQSLLALDALIQEHKKCLNSVVVVKSAASDESAIMLDQRRRDEVKYYLLQRSVKKSAIKLDQ